MPAERPSSSFPALGLVAGALLAAGALAWVLLARAPATMPDPSGAPGSASAAAADRPASVDEERAHYEQLRAEPDPARALEAADEGHLRFVQGALYPDREVIAIRSLLRLGRRDEADQRAQRFLRRYPGTPQADLVRRMLAR